MTQEAFVREHRNDDVRRLALQADRYPDIDMPDALQQIAGWQAARRKLPTWAATDGLRYPPHLSMEQCSSEATAQYKRSLLRGMADATLIDLTGGFGVDFSYMAQGFRRAVYVERNPVLCEIARHNFPLLGLRQAEVVCGDGEEYLHGLTLREAKEGREPVVIYLDPARRDEHGQKTYAISDCTPDVVALKEELLAKADMVIIKLSPMLDWHQAVEALGCVSEVHIVSVENECKELVVVAPLCPPKGGDAGCEMRDARYEMRDAGCEMRDARCEMRDARYEMRDARYEMRDAGCEMRDARYEMRDTRGGLRVVCVNLLSNGEKDYFEFFPHPASRISHHVSRIPYLVSRISHHVSRIPYPAPPPLGGRGAFLYEPNASVMKAGCFAELAERFGVVPLGANSHLFVSEAWVEDFPGRCFVVEHVCTLNKREVKAILRDIQQANIAVRNFPLSAAELRKRLKLKDGGDVYLFGTTIGTNEHRLLVTRKVKR